MSSIHMDQFSNCIRYRVVSFNSTGGKIQNLDCFAEFNNPVEKGQPSRSIRPNAIINPATVEIARLFHIGRDSILLRRMCTQLQNSELLLYYKHVNYFSGPNLFCQFFR